MECSNCKLKGNIEYHARCMRCGYDIPTTSEKSKRSKFTDEEFIKELIKETKEQNSTIRYLTAFVEFCEDGCGNPKDDCACPLK